MEDLSQRIQGLPAELYAHIYHRTFTADLGKPIIIRFGSYRPPHLLHVNRASRAQYASSFYGNTIFEISPQKPGIMAVSFRWLESMSDEHRGLLQDVRLLAADFRVHGTPIKGTHIEDVLKNRLYILMGTFEETGIININAKALSIRLLHEQEGGTVSS